MLTVEEQEDSDDVRFWNQGCRLPRIKWARIESTLGTINIDVNVHRSFKIGRCSEKFKGVSWAKLVTNAGENLLNLEHHYDISINILPCGYGFDLRGLEVNTTENPTCEEKEQRKQEKVTCIYKRITWARIEFNLLPIGLNIDRRHVIGGCSKEFPDMEWSRLVTNAGSLDLDLSLNNEIILNAFQCGIEQVVAEVTKHKECLPPQN